jgi:hypothetical protein
MSELHTKQVHRVARLVLFMHQQAFSGFALETVQ